MAGFQPDGGDYLQREHVLGDRFGRRSGRGWSTGFHPWHYPWMGRPLSPLNKRHNKLFTVIRRNTTEEVLMKNVFLSNVPAKVWNMESLPKADTLNSFLSDKLLKSLKKWIDIITAVHTMTLLLSETIYHQEVKSSRAVCSIISMHTCTSKVRDLSENTKVSFLERLLKLELAWSQIFSQCFTFHNHYQECNSSCDALLETKHNY